MTPSPITRRDACRRVAAGSLACLAGPSLTRAAASPTLPLRYILASSMYGTMSLAEILPEVKATESLGIDLWPKPHGNQREQADTLGQEAFASLLEHHSVKLMMTTRYDLGPYKLQDEIKFLHRFGGKVIVCGAKDAKGDTLKDKVRAFVRSLDSHVAFAEEHGVTIAIENHANSLIESPDSMRYLAEFSRSPNLGVAFAPYHLPQDPHEIARLMEDLGPKLAHFYAWQHGQGSKVKLPKEQEMEQLPGRGSLDFGPLLSALIRMNYAGWTQIFMHPVPRGIPILPTAQAVSRAVNTSRGAFEQSVVSPGK